MDLEDRAFHHAILHNQSPSKLTVAWQYRPWSSAEHAAGAARAPRVGRVRRHSRTTRLPAHMYADVAEDDLSLTSRRRVDALSFMAAPRHGRGRRRGCDGHSFRRRHGRAAGITRLEDGVRQACGRDCRGGSKVTRCMGGGAPMQRLSQLTLTASGFAAHPSVHGGMRAFLTVQQPPLPLPQQPPPVPRDDTFSKVRPISAREDEVEDDSWSCRRCTLINSSSVSRCDACDDPKPNRFKHAKRSEGNHKTIGTVKGAPSTSAAGAPVRSIVSLCVGSSIVLDAFR